MNVLRFIFQLFDRASGPAKRIRDAMAALSLQMLAVRKHFNSLYESTAGLRMVAASVGAAMVAMTAAATAGFAALAIGAASFKEQAQTSFEVLLNSKEMGQKLYRQAIRFAAVTPFETKDVINSYQGLLSYGFKPVEIPIVMAGVGDLASIKGFTSEAVNRIILAMGQIKAKGRLMGQEMLQLTEAGFSSSKFYDILAKKIGTTTEKVRKLQEAGKIDSGTALGGILETIRVTASGGKLGSLMEMQGKTLQGLWSTLKSRPFELLQDFDGMGAFKDLKTVVDNLGKAFDTNTPRGKALQKTLLDLAQTVIGGVFGPLAKATTGDNLLEIVAKVTAGIKRFQVFWAESWPKVIDFFKGFVAGVRAGWQMVVDATVKAKPIIDFISRMIERFTGVKMGAGTAAEQIGRLAGIFAVFVVAAGALSIALLGPISLILKVADAFIFAGRMVYAIINNFIQVGKFAVILYTRFAAWGGLARIWFGFLGVVARVAGGLANFIGWIQRVGMLVQGVALAFRTFATSLLAGLGPIGWIIIAITAVVGVLIWAYNRFDWFKNFVDGIWAGLVKGAEYFYEGLRGVFMTLWGWMTGNTEMQDAGRAILEGIWTGMLSGWDNLKDTVSSLADNIGQWFRDRLGIASPSKVFTGYGGHIVDGLIGGLDAGRNAAGSMVKGIADFMREMWLRHMPTLQLGDVQGGQGGAAGGFGGSGTGAPAGGGFTGFTGQFNGAGGSKIAQAAVNGLSEGWAESMPGYCSKFVRQVFGKALGPQTQKLFGSSAIATEGLWKQAGLTKTLAEMGGKAALKAGDVLFQGYGSGGYGHTGIYAGNGMVAQNTTAAGGGKKLLPLSAFGGITSVGRIPAPAPVAAPANKSGTGGHAITIQQSLTVPHGTPDAQAQKLKQDAHAASMSGTQLALEQIALQAGHS